MPVVCVRSDNLIKREKWKYYSHIGHLNIKFKINILNLINTRHLHFSS